MSVAAEVGREHIRAFHRCNPRRIPPVQVSKEVHMYHFAIVALLGLACWKVTGMVLGFMGREMEGHLKAFVTLLVGVLGTYALDYSLFAGWDIAVRESYMGWVFTGLIVGASAYVWHHMIGYLEAYGRRSRDEARALEGRSRHAA
jgi:hypothetical protein